MLKLWHAIFGHQYENRRGVGQVVIAGGFFGMEERTELAVIHVGRCKCGATHAAVVTATAVFPVQYEYAAGMLDRLEKTAA